MKFSIFPVVSTEPAPQAAESAVMVELVSDRHTADSDSN